MNESKPYKSSRLAFFTKLLFSILFGILIIQFFDFRLILREIRTVNIYLYCVVILGHFLLMALKALRWKILLNNFQIQCSYSEAFVAYVSAFSFGTFTPGQVGDIVKVLLLKGAKGKRKLAVVPSIADRVWDLVGLLFLSTLCSVLLFRKFIGEYHSVAYAVFIGIFSCVIFVFIGFYLKNRIFNEKIRKHIALCVVSWKSSMLITMMVYVIQIIRWSVLSIAMSLPVFPVFAIAIVGNFIALIPVSFGGIGTREGGVAALFKLFDLDPVSGVSFSLLMFGTYIVGAIIGVILLPRCNVNLKEKMSLM